MAVYINSSGHYLPGKAIDNEQIENILGLINGKKSRLKNKILKSNGILQRHYAIDERQNTTISNSEMAANAGLNCIDNSFLSATKIQMLSCATSQGDMVLPGFGSMVQAALNISEVELHTSHGICSSSMMALKTAFNNIKCHDNENALVIASELTSRLFKNTRYEQVENNDVDFNAEFLRWMLSDGAGALLLENKPRATGKSVRIDWIKSFSHANHFPVCMSVGQARNEEHKTWQDYPTYAAAEKAGALLLRQDVRLLENIVSVGVQGFLKLISQKYVEIKKIDHVLCHFSSKYFKSKIFEMLETAGASIPEEKWYTNLYQRGNTGCASIFIMLDEFIKTHDLKVGETIFCMVPESGRFNCAYMHLTVAG
ncbi:beta-ketoacyl-ACP synthase III [Paraglaciecola sp. L3A3]|uniref:beta-ketoacyl-ACP synthase III n=1 Tax=Paraglaciecola sp. L3A3 TaxID=2686358 RepID=UPI00131E6738|nr:beta-ketoacyl-ACP synthase III [Paraglaciecola sp. L3A3]